MILEYNGHRPIIGKNVFIAPTAVVIGDVVLKDGASIWYGAVVRGDRDTIIVGQNSNIQDNCTVHSDTDKPVIIGDHVTIGHNAVIHACTIEDNCLIGISAAVLTGACIKTGSVVAAGSVVMQGQVIGPYQLFTGVPASLKKELPEETSEKCRQTAVGYLDVALDHIAINKTE
ncbi:MAG: gamma carbonic anhydrase family protein [Proteobacteria bacterium]|nr:gamma carbonic anhydrase family protein [Pseudomonadota bacterium]